jgi:zinc transporter ZupT
MQSEAGEAFEWAGVFALPEMIYMWTSQKVDGKYADNTMKLVAIPVASATEAALHGVEEDGKASLSVACTDVNHAGTIIPGNGTCNRLVFNQNLWQSLFTINASSAAAVAFFTEHVPTEFEATAHYLKDSKGEDVEPAAELPEKAKDAEKDKPWGKVIGSAIVVNLVTLVGVILAVPAVRRGADFPACQGMLAGFAAGCILAAAVFLLMFEATHLVGVGWKEEVEVLWRWGTCILAGFTLPGVVDCAVSVLTQTRSTEQDAEANAEENAEQPLKSPMNNKVRILAGVLIGDFFHNFCDGIFIGTAFKGCSDTLGWTVFLSTVLHEIPQEIADYSILTSKGVDLHPAIALLLNFLSGMSVLLGAIIMVASDVSDDAVGLLLAFGAGTYLHIGATECMPKIYSDKLKPGARAGCIATFILGTVLIGLILLDHEHCVPSAEGGGGGHAHGH